MFKFHASLNHHPSSRPPYNRPPHAISHGPLLFSKCLSTSSTELRSCSIHLTPNIRILQNFFPPSGHKMRGSPTRRLQNPLGLRTLKGPCRQNKSSFYSKDVVLYSARRTCPANGDEGLQAKFSARSVCSGLWSFTPSVLLDDAAVHLHFVFDWICTWLVFVTVCSIVS